MTKKHWADSKRTANKIAKQLSKKGYDVFVAEIPKRLKKIIGHKYVVTRRKRK